MIHLLLAAAKDPPMIDLDGTVFIQLGLFLIAAFFLTTFLFKPYLKVRAAREAGIDGARDDARRMDEEAKARMAAYDARFAHEKAKVEAERAVLRREAVARDTEISEEARKSTQEALEAARKSIERDAKEARDAIEPKTAEIATSIAKKILGREVS
jgi:F-type H+-transporting ATPase subunit b